MSARAALGCRISRRQVLKLSGAGALVLAFGETSAQPSAAGTPAADAPFAPNAWLRIGHDGFVDVSIAKTEMGQGTETGIAMIVADELDADWSRVRVRTMRPDGKRFMITGGSYSISESWEPARQAAAAARHMLLQAGATALGVDAAACRTDTHAVALADGSRRIGYAQLVRAAAALPVPKSPALKPDDRLTLVGKPLPAKNLEAIVRAQATYGIDVRVPDMLHAVVERAPAVNGRIAGYDDRAARAVPGVVAVVPIRGNQFPTRDLYVRDGVAVVARNTWAAMEGRKRLKIQWQTAGRDSKSANGALVSTAALSRDFDRALEGKATRQAPDLIHRPATALREGTADAMKEAFAAAARRLEMRYELPLQAHAPMEPVNAVAHWQPDRCEIWAGTHFQSRLLRNARDVTGLPADRIVIHTPLLGGSFGRRLEPDFAIEAILVSRQMRRPVQLLWTREDDLREGLFAPPSRHQVRVALDADGNVLAFEHDFAAISVRQQIELGGTNDAGIDHTVVFDAIKFPYATRTRHVSQRLVEAAVRVFWWRRGFTPNHTFANESALDECAHAAGADPLAYRLRLLGPARIIEHDNDGDPERIDTGRLAAVLKRACDEAGWSRARPAGTGLGLASTVTDTHVAHVVEVDARGGSPGTWRVVRVVTAVDCGRVINPQLVRAQVEGSIVFALTAALKGEITLEGGRVQQSNFHDYPLLRFDEMPRVDTVLLDSGAAPTGIGEQASHAVAAAVANAVFAATGKRLRKLPLTG